MSFERLPGDPSLPPGVTHADIDRHFGGEDVEVRCDECGNENVTEGEACGACGEYVRTVEERNEDAVETYWERKAGIY